MILRTQRCHNCCDLKVRLWRPSMSEQIWFLLVKFLIYLVQNPDTHQCQEFSTGQRVFVQYIKPFRPHLARPGDSRTLFIQSNCPNEPNTSFRACKEFRSTPKQNCPARIASRDFQKAVPSPHVVE